MSLGGGSDKSYRQTRRALNVQENMWNQTRSYTKWMRDIGQAVKQPFLEAALGETEGWWNTGDYMGYTGPGKYALAYENLPSRLNLAQIQEDPIYQWRLGEMQGNLDKYLAGKGKLYSSLAPEKYASLVNALTAEESDKLYGREVNKLLALYGLGQSEEANIYQRLLNAVNVGTAGSNLLAGAAGQYAQGTAGLYGQQAAIQAQQAAANQSNMSTIMSLGGAGIGAGLGNFLGFTAAGGPIGSLGGAAIGAGLGGLLSGFLG